ncbi:hypothetical protein [Nocardia jiangsuensis]|uniref:Uncharacterized protein n=1 Tax=Nocardia jiangsuensis TaxID=1691563 RepID=A0ABV8E045_9NOCA
MGNQEKLEVLLADYAAARDDEREFPNQQVAMFSGVLATLTLFGVFAVSIGGQNISLPDPVAAATPLIPLSFFCLLQILGSEATIRSFYLRALEREIRRTASVTIPLAEYPPLRPMMYRELIDEARSLSRGAKRLRVITYIVFFSVTFVFIGLVAYMARDFNGALKAAMLAVYGPAIVLLYLEAVQATVKGRQYFESVVNSADLRLHESLRPPPSPPSGSLLRQPGLIAYLILPRPNDLPKGLFFPVGVMVLVTLRPEIAGQSFFWQRVLILWFILEFLIYQGRYQINDVRGIKEDAVSPGAVQRRRIPTASLDPSTAVKVVLFTVLVRFALSVILCGLSFISFFHHVLPMIIGVWLIAALYEFFRGQERKRFEASTSISIPPKSTMLAVVVTVLVGLGYPVRMLLGVFLPPTNGEGQDVPWEWKWPWNSEYVWTDGGINPIALEPQVSWQLIATLFAYSYLLGIIFVSMTWCLEGGSYVTRSAGPLSFSTVIAGATYYYDRKIFKKPHLPLMTGQLICDFSLQSTPFGTPVDGRTVKWLLRGSKRRGVWNLAIFPCSVLAVVLVPEFWKAPGGDLYWSAGAIFILVEVVWIFHRRRSALLGRLYLVITAASGLVMIAASLGAAHSKQVPPNSTQTILYTGLSLAALALPMGLYKFFELQSYEQVMKPIVPPGILNKFARFLLRLIVGKETASLL